MATQKLVIVLELVALSPGELTLNLLPALLEKFLNDVLGNLCLAALLNLLQLPEFKVSLEEVIEPLLIKLDAT